MKIIVGLGNPTKESFYIKIISIYNYIHMLIGKIIIILPVILHLGLLGKIMFLDFLNKNYLGGEFKTFKNSKIIEGNIDNEKVILAKPQTYMNLSGDAVIKLKNWYKVDNNDILVIYDDFDIPFESVRYRDSGSAGTHNGMKDIVNKLATKDIPRLRIGTGGLKKENQEVISFVLSKFSKDELDELNNVFEKAYLKFKEFLDK